jgi:regulation of enolase protein 1 (concanavalin A-like superfamily)
MDGKDPVRAPRLVRNVEGNFVAQVRVGGVFRPKGNGEYRAGLVVTDGTYFITFERTAVKKPGEGQKPLRIAIQQGRACVGFGLDDRSVLTKPTYLRLERRGDTQFRAASSEDGKKWTPLEGGDMPDFDLRKVKVGVIAEATASGTFKPWFEDFQLTPLGGQTP